MLNRIIIAACLLITSCSTFKYYPIKGRYVEPPFEIITPTNRETVWDKLIDLFAQKGLSIKIIDKSSGLIISEETRMPWSMEDKNGNLYKKDAYIILPRRTISGKLYNYVVITGEWNVRIKSNTDGKTVIDVNILNIKERTTGAYGPIVTPLQSAYSTGLFEQIIVGIIK